MSIRQKLTEYEIIKGCAEYLKISEADIIRDDFVRAHPDVMDVLVNVAIACRKKAAKEDEVTHRRRVALNLDFYDIDYSTISDAEVRTRRKIHNDIALKKKVSEIVSFIADKDYMSNDFEILASKIVGYHGHDNDVVIPDGLQLGELAFSGCDTIQSVKLNREIKIIPWRAFSNCKSLTLVSGLERVGKIGPNAFACCESLCEFEIPFGVERIERHTFLGCTSLKKINIPSTIIEIGYAAFQDCKSLEKVQLPESLKEIGAQSFMYCNGLEEIGIPDSVEKIGEAAFEFCNSLKSVSFSEHTRIGRNAFSTTPWETKFVKGGAFITNGILHKVDEALKEYEIPEDVTEIAMAAFEKSNVTRLTIPKNVRYIAPFAFADSKIEEIHFVCEECEFDHSLFDHCGKIKEIVLPKHMKRIYEHTFGNTNAIIEVSESVEAIDYNAFTPSPLTKLTGMNPKIRAKEGTLAAEFAREYGIELILE